MEIFEYFDKDLDSVFASLKNNEDVINYEKIDQDDFVILPEKGFSLQSGPFLETVSDIRVYLLAKEDFFPIDRELLGDFKNVNTLADLHSLIGPKIMDIKSVNIPGLGPTLPGAKYLWGDISVSAYVNDGGEIVNMLFSRRCQTNSNSSQNTIITKI